jgi:hypothetical protein
MYILQKSVKLFNEKPSLVNISIIIILIFMAVVVGVAAVKLLWLLLCAPHLVFEGPRIINLERE